MQTPLEIAKDYLAVWNADTAPERQRRLAEWCPDATYRDPLMQAEGRAAIFTMIEAARQRFAGLAFCLHGTPDGHGPFARFAWTLGPDGGTALAAGTDIVRLNAQGCVAEVIGFLDAVRP